MLQQLLHCGNVVAIGKQVRAEGVPGRVASLSLGRAGLLEDFGHCFLDNGVVEVMPPLLARPNLQLPVILREDPLPTPVGGVGIVAVQGFR